MSSDFELMTYRQLQRACKEHGLDANGNRQTLLDRLSSVKDSQPKRRSSKITRPTEEAPDSEEEQAGEEEEQEDEQPEDEEAEEEQALPESEPDGDGTQGTEGKQEVVGCIIRRVAPSGDSKEEETEDLVFVTDDEVKRLYTEAFTSKLTELVAREEDEDESDREETQTLGSVLSRHTRKLGLSRSVSSALLVIELCVVFFAFLLQGQMSPPAVLLLSSHQTDTSIPADVSPPAGSAPVPVPPATPLPQDPFSQAKGSLFEAGGEHQVTSKDGPKPHRPKLPTVEPSQGAFFELLSAAYTQAFALSFWTNLIGYFVLFIVVPTAFGLLLGKYTTPQSVFAFAVTRFALWYLLSPGLSDDFLGVGLPFKLFMITTFTSLTTAFWDHCKA